MTEPEPAKLAAIDQQLAEIGDRLDRNARSIMHGEASMLLIALTAVKIGRAHV